MKTGKLGPYLPRVALRRLMTAPVDPVVTLEGTVVFVDVSGFTKLSERLARTGKEGAEHLTDVINSCFSSLLADAYFNGGSLLKFGGDALLLWFEGEGHEVRACASAVAMRSTLRQVGRIDTGSSKIVLRMSVGVHSGPYSMFFVGQSHREFVIAGPAASTVVAMEARASAGQILISESTAQALSGRCLGAALDGGFLLTRAPGSVPPVPAESPATPPDEVIAECLSTTLRQHLLAGPVAVAPEHRTATVAFLQFGELDELIERRGPVAAAEAVDEVVSAVQEATDRYEVCFLSSDIYAGGGKLLLTAGAPRAVGDDEERMLLALRSVINADSALPVRIGVNRGQLFAGEIGPHYRRTYTVMGDSVNLGARLMAKAPWRSIYATQGVIDRSQTRFETSSVEAFMVKGKSRPVEAQELGPARRATAGERTRTRLPLVARDAEREALQTAIAQTSEGRGSVIEIVGETGSGKSRLLAEARDLAPEMPFVHVTCEAYRRDIPYGMWRDPLRRLLGLRWNDSGEVVAEGLRQELAANAPDLLPWLPLLAIVLDAPSESTREVDELAADSRSTKLHEVVIQFLQPALQTPTLVQIEHAHLMDEASGALLHALAEGLPASPWVLLVTRRDAEDGFVAGDAEAIRLELGPLSRADSMALAEATPEAHVTPPHLLELAVDRAGGSPEFLIDLLAAVAGGSTTLPDSIDAAASARLDVLGPGDRALVRRAAVLGLAFHPGRLREVLDPDTPEPDDRTWQRLASVFALDDDGHVRFKRPAIQEVAYESLPFRLRRELHAAVGESLERGLGDDVDAEPAVLSLHFILARDYERAWRYARTGAERAGARFAHADAARLYRRAIEAGRGHGATQTELAECWEALGEALRKAGEPKAANQALSTARHLVTGDRLAGARLLSKHAQIAERSGRLTAAVRWANRGIAELESMDGEDATRLRAGLTASLAAIRGMQGHHAQAEQLARRAIAQADSVAESPATALACRVLDTALVDAGRPDEAIHSARALEIYERLEDLENQSAVLNNMGMFAYFRWEWDEAIDLYRRAAEAAERAGRTEYLAYTDCNIGEILSDQGRLDDARPHLARSRRIWSATGNRAATYSDVLLGRLAVRSSRFGDGLALLEQAAAQWRAQGSKGYADNARAFLAEGEAFGGDPVRALAITSEMRDVSDSYVPVPLVHRIRGIGLARIGEIELADEELHKSLAAARERSMQYELAATIDAMALLGHADAGLSHERDAILERLGIIELPRPVLSRKPVAGSALAAAAT